MAHMITLPMFKHSRYTFHLSAFAAAIGMSLVIAATVDAGLGDGTKTKKGSVAPQNRIDELIAQLDQLDAQLAGAETPE